jgi:geranylgeranyl diphosphate synthase type II
MEGADENQHSQLVKWIEAEEYDPEEKVAAVTSLYNEIGVRQICEDLVNKYFDDARQLLEKVALPADRKETLWQYALGLLGRNS